MKHKCFISFKREDQAYKTKIQEELNINMIDKSLNEKINSTDEDYIMRRIREDYLSDSCVTIHLIGKHSSEDKGLDEQVFIKRELQASLYNGDNNSRNGILGVVLPSMYDCIFQGSYTCWRCKSSHAKVIINDTTVVKEFSYNYYLPPDKCAWDEDDRFCVLVKWVDFCKDPEKYIDQAFSKREHPIAKKVKVRPE